METKKCLSCGKEFSKPKRKTKKEFINQKYCSRWCINIWRISKKKWKKLSEETKAKMVFYKKWSTPWNKWLKYNDEQKSRLNIEWIRFWPGWNRWKKYTEEQKKKINIEWLKMNWWKRKWSKHNEETRKKISISNKWKRLSEEAKKKISDYNIRTWKVPVRKYKQDHWNWKWWITPENKKIRRSIEYKEWRKKVFERDWYACVLCRKQWYLHADHIKPFCKYKELRFDVNNWRTLCVECHLKTETFWTKAINF